MAAVSGRTLPRRHQARACDLAHAIEHARILRAAGDLDGASKVLDDAFAAEGVRAPAASESQRFRAMVQRAELALTRHEPKPDGGGQISAEALGRIIDGLLAHGAAR